jgi:hypothetical protein
MFVTKWGTSGSGDGQFSGPAGIAFVPSVTVPSTGFVYVTDSYNGTLPSNDRVQKFSCP